MTKYSDWFKVDLHIHTDASTQTKTNDYDGTFSIITLKSKLVDNDVKLFSLTDHNIINTSAYEEYYKSFKVGDPILLLGCEFDIKVRQYDESFLTYHTLLIFDESTTEKVQEISKIIENHFNKNGVNIKERSLTEDQIFELFHPYHFFYIPHAGGHKNIIDAYKGADIQKAQEMVLLMECAHEKVKEKHRVKHHEGFDKLKDPAFRDREDEAFINFSDNHNCNDYPTPKNGAVHEFYCLKGEPTFETLRFAFIDPKSRIRKQNEVDLLKNVKKHISILKIEGLENIDNGEIEFSPNLNVIIGGASSGKSLLFSLIGKKIQNNNHDFEKYKKNDSKVLIKSSNSQTFQRGVPFNNDEVIFINQGDILRYFEQGELRELVKDSGKESHLQAAKAKIIEQKQKLIDELESFKKRFDSFNTAYHKDLILHEGDFDNMLNDKFHFVAYTSLNTLINYDEKDYLLQEIKGKIESVKEDEIFEFSPDDIYTIEQFEKLLSEKQHLVLNKRLIQNSINNFIEDVNRILEDKNNTLESSSRAKKEAFSRKKELIDICEKLFREAMEFNESSLILENYEYEEKEEITIDETVTVILEIENNIDLKEAIINCINGGSICRSIYMNYFALADNNEKLKNYDEYTDQRLIQKLKKESESILNKFDSPRTYLNYGENGNSKNKSPGFNAEMYLKTILQNEKCKLVLIDQPEDNLGNSFKNEDLINLLRKYKFTKQIILVTHNPSIVVYGDAESIILAENNQGQISYKQLVLEKKECQNLIINNLDGGKAIFDIRSRKYNIKKLLNS